MVQKEMSFKDFSYLELSRPSCCGAKSFRQHFGKGHYQGGGGGNHVSHNC